MIYMTKLFLRYSLILSLTSCSADLFESFAYRDIFLFYKGYITGFDSDVISEEVFKRYEYSFANVKIGRGEASTVVLAYIEDNVYEWRSNDGIKIFTVNGMIVKTEGFESDMTADKFDVLNSKNHSKEFISYLAFKNPDLYRSALYNKIFYHKTHKMPIERLGGEVNADIMTHTIELPIIKWKAKNQYYLYNDIVIRTEQFIHPNMPKIKIDFYLK
mgnify:CR=1 FL=1